MFQVSVPNSYRSFEDFVTESFDSEEAVMIVLVLRAAGEPLTTDGLLDRLEQSYRIERDEPRRLAEKRIELRLRDLAARGLVDARADATFRYRAEGPLDTFVAKLADSFASDRAAVDRLIYSIAAKARRVAGAFRL
jgi:hypothetical protein